MRCLEGNSFPRRQRGAALLILLSLLSVAIAYAVVAGLNRSAGDIARARDLKTYAALAQAKAAMIAYAVTYKDTHDKPASNSYTVPGYLPCPDLGTSAYEGQAASTCGGSLVSVMGRLPWRTLGLDTLKDSSGECLWYAVSGTYKNYLNAVSGSTTTSNMMNWDNNGQFNVMDTDGVTILTGSTDDTNAVAVIFAPGAALAGQDRTPAAGTTNCGGNYSAAAYLETAGGINNSVVSGTALAPSSFIAGTASNTFNDKLVYITRADIWNAIKKRADFNNYLRAMTRLAAECVANYGNHNGGGDARLPWPSNVSLSGTSVPTYAVNAQYDDAANLMAGRLSFNVNNSATSTNNDLPHGTPSYIFSDLFNSYCNSDSAPYSADQQVWYDHWKDQLFYAVANDFKPSAAWSWWSQWFCGTCLKINNDGNNYAAVVMLAGEKLAGQARNTAADRGSIANYLEGRNLTTYPNSAGNSNYQAAVASTGFNDVVYAIDTYLNVWCSKPNGVMRSVPGATTAPPGTGNLGAYYTDLADYAACP